MAKWRRPSALSVARCVACGYVYDEAAESGSSSGVKAGTKFEDMPKDWKRPRLSCRKVECPQAFSALPPTPRGVAVARCPVCGAEKSAFERVEE